MKIFQQIFFVNIISFYSQDSKKMKIIQESYNKKYTWIRDGPDIWFSIRYPAKSGHFSAIQYPAGYQVLKNGISGFQISGQISSKLDIKNTIFSHTLRCFNFLSNSVEQLTGIAPNTLLCGSLNFIQIEVFSITHLVTHSLRYTFHFKR